MSQTGKSYLTASIMVLLAAMFYSYEYLLRVIPSVIVPELMSSLNIGPRQIGLISSYYFLIYTPMQIIVGTILDHYGVKKPLTIATISCAIGIYVFAIPSLYCAKAGMFLVGLGSAFAFVGVLKISADWLPRKYFALISGLTTALGMIGATLGETATATVISRFGIQDTMSYISMIGILLAIAIFFIIKDKNKNYSKNYTAELNKLCGDLTTVIARKQIWLNGIIGMLIFTPTTTFAGLWGVPYLKMTRNISTTKAGAIISAIFFGWMIGGPIVGILTNYIKRRKIILTYGALLSCIVMVKILYFPSDSTLTTVTMMFLLGLFSSSEILVFAVANDIIEDKLTGTAISLTNMFVMASGGMQYIIGSMLEYFALGSAMAANNQHIYSEQVYQQAFAAMPIGLMLAFILSFRLQETFYQKKDRK